MKKIATTIGLSLLFMVSSYAENVDVRINNARVEGGYYKFDLQINATDDWAEGFGQDGGLGNSDWYFNRNAAAFGANLPAYENLEATLAANADDYTFIVQVNGGMLQVKCTFHPTDWAYIPSIGSWQTLLTVTWQIDDAGQSSGITWDTSNTGMQDGDGDALTIDNYNGSGDISLPVKLFSFSAEPEDKGVVVRWTTQSETDNLGFILERAVSGDWQEIASYQTVDELKGQGNTSASTDYAFLDEDAPFGQVVQYRLSDVNTAGEAHVYDVLQITLEVRPEATVLKPAYPNPFNPETNIKYELAERAEVTLVVYDLLGRKVKTLVSQPQAIGSYDLFWHADDESGREVASGMYFLVLNAGKIVKTQKVTVVR